MKSKQILIAGGYPHHLMSGVGEEFIRRGWEVSYFDSSPESPWHRPLIKPVRKLIHNLRIQRHPETFDKSPISNLGWRSRLWLKKIQEVKPDMALILRGNRFAHPWLKQGMELVPHAVWYLEPPSRLESFIEELKGGEYQKICCYSYMLTQEIEKAGYQSRFVPHQSSVSVEREILYGMDRKYDWVFLGSHTPWREKLFRTLLTIYPNTFLQGPRWDRVAARDPLFKRVVHEGYYGKNEIISLYGNAFVGVDTFDSEKGEGYGITMRAPELISCGCRLVTQYSDEWNYLFDRDQKNVSFYKDERELIDCFAKALEKAKSGKKSSIEEKTIKDYCGYQEFVDYLVS